MVGIYTFESNPQNSTIMKKAKLIVIICLFLSCLLHADNTTKEQVRIIKGTTVTDEVDRTLFRSVEVFFIPQLNLLEITCDATGDADVYVIDENDQVVSITSLLLSDASSYVDAPMVSGVYSIIIVSDTFYGVGKFIVN